MGVPQRHRRPPRWLSEEPVLYVISPGRMRRTRKDQGYSQEELALLCRCTQSMISAIETGARKGCQEDLAMLIAKKLRQPSGYLFSEAKPSVSELTSAVDDDFQESA